MKARITKHNGAMTLFINGAPVPLTAFKPTELNDDALFATTVRRSVRDMAARGVHVHFVPVFFAWPGPGRYDFAAVDWRIGEVLQADPAGYVVIRVQAKPMAPAWWLDANPDGVLKFGSGREPELPSSPYRTPRSPSLASAFWDDAGIPALQALAAHVRRQNYAERVIGYLPTAYNTNEWFVRSYDDLQVSDLCPAMAAAFAKHIQAMTGANAPVAVPDRFARAYGDRGYLFHPDPAQSRAPVVEYYRFVNGLCAETVLKITKALRAAHAPDQIIVGTFYGYAHGLANFYWLPDSGHLNLARLLEEEGPDFTCSPLEYFTRNSREEPAGGFCWAQGTAPDSGLLAGKGYFGEDDYCPPRYDELVGWSSAADAEEDAELLKRNFVFTLCKNQLQWWYDLHGHWFESPERLGAVEQCVGIARAALDRDRTPVAQVAVVMDERASWYVTLDRQFQRAVFWENFCDSFGHLGAPVNLLLVSDLATADLTRYRAVFLPTCFALNDQERGWIDRLKGEGRTLVFYQADGFINPDATPAMAAAHMGSLTGMNIVDTASLFQLRVTTGVDHPLLIGYANRPFGIHTEKLINFHVDDPAAEPLGYYSGRGPVGLACKQHAGWMSIYCGVPVLPAAIVRNIVREAGVHLYGDAEDVLYANRSYCGVFVRGEGARTIRLPRPCQVRECFSNTQLAAEPVKWFSWDAKPYHTYLFELT